MATQMYDVFDDKDRFLMRTSLPVIAVVWILHREAVQRIETETNGPGGICQVHANGKLRLGGDRVIVQKAVGDLPEIRE